MNTTDQRITRMFSSDLQIPLDTLAHLDSQGVLLDSYLDRLDGCRVFTIDDIMEAAAFFDEDEDTYGNELYTFNKQH